MKSRRRSFKKAKQHLPAKTILGRVERKRRGIAFFVPLIGSSDDIFIPRNLVHSFGDGDVVEAEISNSGELKNLRLVEKKRRFVVAFVKSQKAIFWYDNYEFQARVSQDWKDGYWYCKVCDFSDKLNEPLEIEKEKYLGETLKTHELDLMRIIAQKGLYYEPPEDAKNYDLKNIQNEDEGSRVNLTKLPFFTIDGENARDHDDAVYVERLGTGYRLYVAIADVAYYVKPGSEIDKEAYLRGNSTYFANTFLPMLPHKLTKEVCSLTNESPKYAMVAVIDYDENGERVFYKFQNALVKPKELTTYNAVMKMIEEKTSPEMLVAFDLYKLLQEARNARGALILDFPSTIIDVDSEGATTSITKRMRIATEEMIEEFMLEANRAAAEILNKNGDGIYRVHDEPGEIDIADCFKFARSFGVEGKTLNELVLNSRGKVFSPAISMKVLRTMRIAQYSDLNSGHYGLALEDYTHFTSPIRRYSDLIVHRLIKGILAKKKGLIKKEELTKLAGQCSYRERVSEEAEREEQKIRKLRMLETLLGQEFVATIVNITEKNVWAEIDTIPVDGAISVDRLPGNVYMYDEKNYTLVERRGKRRFRIGDKLDIIVSKVNVLGSIAEFDLVGE